MKNIFILSSLLYSMLISAQINKCQLYSDSGKTEVSKVTCSELANMNLVLKVPVIDNIKNYWYMVVDVKSNYIRLNFAVRYENDSMQNICKGKELIYLTLLDSSHFSDFICDHVICEKVMLNHTFLCDADPDIVWWPSKKKNQVLTVTVTFLGEVVDNYNGSNIYRREEFSSEILRIKRNCFYKIEK